MEQTSNKNPINILSGKAVHGRGIGKLVGMPTANMEVPDVSILPPAGVYVAEILLEDRRIMASRILEQDRLLIMIRKFPLRRIF